MASKIAVRVKMVLDDWRRVGEVDSIYDTERGIQLSLGDLHSGTTFDATIVLREEVMKEIMLAWKQDKSFPVFSVMME